MSLGSSATQHSSEDPVCMAAEAAWNSGIVVCVAAGNKGPEDQTINSPGIDPKIITVGAIDDKNSLTPDEVKTRLIQYSVSLGEEKNSQGAGLVTVYKAITSQTKVITPQTKACNHK